MLKIFYLSPASGTQCRVCRVLRYPYILVNFMTKNSSYYAKTARTFANILLIDSGGFPSSFIHNGYDRSDLEYLHFVRKVRADYFVLRDYPCEPQILQKYSVTAKDQIHRTLEHHLELLELYERLEIKAQPIPVIQGWEIDDYIYCIDLFKEHGLIDRFDYIAIGSTCRRYQVKTTQQIILTVREELPSRIKLHAFGVKLSVLDNKAVWDALYSADSSAWDFIARWKSLRTSDDTSLLSYNLALNYLAKIENLRRIFSSQLVLSCSCSSLAREEGG